MSITEETRQQVLARFGKMSPFFVPNFGQTDARIDYYVRGSSHQAYFMRGEVFLTFGRPLMRAKPIKLTLLRFVMRSSGRHNSGAGFGCPFNLHGPSRM
jgi:hypothetical protein